jgi:hypothetical protein
MAYRLLNIVSIACVKTDSNPMKRLLLATILGISALATHAADFRDNDLIGGADKNINQNDDPVTGVFDLVTAGAAPDAGGFAPPKIVTSAVATFDFEANGEFPMSFDIFLDDILFGSGVVPVNGSLTYKGGGDEIINGPDANHLAILAALGVDGILNYKVVRTDENPGTLAFNSADLVVTADAVLPPDAVVTPDAGSTFALAGLGLAAVASLRRKFAK